METDEEIDYFMIQNIYVDICYNLANNYELEYDSNYIYLSTMPDFIEGNESCFVDHKSDRYKCFITDKIEHYLNNKHLYVIKPSIIILLKIIKLFDEEQEDDELIILYNRLLHMINYMHPSALFINEEYVKCGDKYELVTNRYVRGSTIVQVYENLPSLTDFNNFLRKIFTQERNNYDLLLSELQYIDNNYDINSDKYHSLKSNLYPYTIKFTKKLQ